MPAEKGAVGDEWPVGEAGVVVGAAVDLATGVEVGEGLSGSEAALSASGWAGLETLSTAGSDGVEPVPQRLSDGAGERLCSTGALRRREALLAPAQTRQTLRPRRPTLRVRLARLFQLRACTTQLANPATHSHSDSPSCKSGCP